MGALTRYISLIYLSRFAILLFGLVSVVLSFDMLERSDNVLQAVGGGAETLLRYALLRMPEVTSQLLAIAALLAALLALAELSRHGELDAMWASGISPMQLLSAFLPVAIVLTGLQFSLDNWGIPQSAEVLRAWGVAKAEDSGAFGKDHGVWLRSGNDVIRLPRDAARAGNLRNMTIFRRSQDGVLIERLDASTAWRSNEGWLLGGVTRQSAQSFEQETFPQLLWKGEVNPEHVSKLARDPREISLHEIWEIIAKDAYGQRQVQLYQTWFHERIISAPTPFLMILLVVSLIQAIGRSAAFGWIFVASLGISFVFFVFDRATLAMGEVGVLPSWLAAWGPNLILAGVAGTLVLHRESSRSPPTRPPGSVGWSR